MIRYHVYFDEMQISYEAKINTRHLPDMANLMVLFAKPRHFQNSPPSIQLLVRFCSPKKGSKNIIVLLQFFEFPASFSDNFSKLHDPAA